MKPYAYIGARSEHRVDYSQVCRDCWQFPNRCDHIGAPIIYLQVIDDDPIAETAREIETRATTAPPLADLPFSLTPETSTRTPKQRELL